MPKINVHNAVAFLLWSIVNGEQNKALVVRQSVGTFFKDFFFLSSSFFDCVYEKSLINRLKFQTYQNHFTVFQTPPVVFFAII